MSTEHNFHLVKAVVDALILFEFCDPALVDSDIAVEAQEQIAADLQMMDAQAKRAFCSQLNLIATAYSGDRADFIHGLADSLGLD